MPDLLTQDQHPHDDQEELVDVDFKLFQHSQHLVLVLRDQGVRRGIIRPRITDVSHSQWLDSSTELHAT